MRALVVLALLLSAFGGSLAATAPFDVETGRPVVALTVNGRGPYPFVLDTGAPGLIVTRTLADELALEISGATEVNSPMGGPPVEASLARVASIALGGATVADLEAVVLDMAGTEIGMGIVGPAVFHGHGPLTLDFKNNIIVFGDDAKPAGAETWLPFGKSAPLLDVPVRIGELLIDGHIDTGSPGTLSVPIDFVDRLPLTGPVRQVGKARTVDAEFEIRAAPIEATVRIGDAEIPLTEVHLAELPGANLGTGGLRGLSLHVDWKNERFALTGTADPVAVRRRAQAVAAGTGPRFGILASPCARCAIEVLGTEPDSPAEEIGLLQGDRILAINGKPTDELEFTQVRAELTAAELELEIERDGQRVLLKRAD